MRKIPKENQIWNSKEKLSKALTTYNYLILILVTTYLIDLLFHWRTAQNVITLFLGGIAIIGTYSKWRHDKNARTTERK